VGQFGAATRRRQRASERSWGWFSTPCFPHLDVVLVAELVDLIFSVLAIVLAVLLAVKLGL
jgi:hypothetical protein